MNDKNPTPDQTPENAASPAASTPPPSPDAPTVPVEPAVTPGTADATPSVAGASSASEPTPAAAESAPVTADNRPRRKRALLIGGGIAAAVLLAGGGVAVGAAIGDEFGDDDDRPSMSDGPRGDDGERPGDDRGGQPGDDRDDDGPRPQGGGPVTGIGTDSADDLVDIADAARGVAEGEVTSIDAKRDGTWEVQLETATGAESEVRVDADGTATAVSTETEDGDDTGPTLSLDEATIRALVDAALAEADGMITDLDVDDDGSSPYDASVLTSDNRSIDIDFSADFAVVGTDSDD